MSLTKLGVFSIPSTACLGAPDRALSNRLMLTSSVKLNLVVVVLNLFRKYGQSRMSPLNLGRERSSFLTSEHNLAKLSSGMAIDCSASRWRRVRESSVAVSPRPLTCRSLSGLELEVDGVASASACIACCSVSVASSSTLVADAVSTIGVDVVGRVPRRRVFILVSSKSIYGWVLSINCVRVRRVESRSYERAGLIAMLAGCKFKCLVSFGGCCCFTS